MGPASERRDHSAGFSAQGLQRLKSRCELGRVLTWSTRSCSKFLQGIGRIHFLVAARLRSTQVSNSCLLFIFAILTIFSTMIKNSSPRIYHLNHCRSVEFSNVKYTHIVVKQIFKTFSSRRSETLYPLNNSPFLPPRISWEPAFCCLSLWVWLLWMPPVKWNHAAFFFLWLAYCLFLLTVSLGLLSVPSVFPSHNLIVYFFKASRGISHFKLHCLQCANTEPSVT